MKETVTETLADASAPDRGLRMKAREYLIRLFFDTKKPGGAGFHEKKEYYFWKVQPDGGSVLEERPVPTEEQGMIKVLKFLGFAVWKTRTLRLTRTGAKEADLLWHGFPMTRT